MCCTFPGFLALLELFLHLLIPGLASLLGSFIIGDAQPRLHHRSLARPRLTPLQPTFARGLRVPTLNPVRAKQQTVGLNVAGEGTFANPVEQGEIVLRFPTPLVPRSTDKELHT